MEVDFYKPIYVGSMVHNAHASASDKDPEFEMFIWLNVFCETALKRYSVSYQTIKRTFLESRLHSDKGLLNGR